MNKTLYYILSAALLFTAGCSKQEDGGGSDGEFGRLRITCTPDDQIVVRATTPAEDVFSLLLSTNGKASMYWDTVTDFNNENPLLTYGDYNATVAWGDPASEGVDCPYFFGEKAITILPRQTSTVSITAKMIKAQALIRTTERFRTYFRDIDFTVTTGSGNIFHYYFASTATPAKPDSDETIYICAERSLSITGTAYKQAPTSDSERPRVTFPEQQVDGAKAATRYIFEFDAADAGSATLRILLDDTLVDTVAIEVELNKDSMPE